MKKILEIGRPIQRNMWSNGNNTTRSMNFTRVTPRSQCMKILDAIITHPGKRRIELTKMVYGKKFRPTRNWNHGFFAALSAFGLATYERHGHNVTWKATPKGIHFYESIA